MELDKALSQLSEIRGHIAKTETFHGLKTIPLSLTGAGAFAAALLQPLWIEDGRPVSFILYWSGVAALNILIFAAALLYNSYHHTEVEKQVTRQILMQFCPCLLIGGLLAITACIFKGQLPYFMPGIWCMILALGIFSSRPYLPPNIVFAGGYYVLAGLALFLCVKKGVSLNAWSMGLSFGIGQLIAALLFYFDLERNHGKEKDSI